MGEVGLPASDTMRSARWPMSSYKTAPRFLIIWFAETISRLGLSKVWYHRPNLKITRRRICLGYMKRNRSRETRRR